ncbi:DUF4190 domain-containing protein [Mycobacterium sp. SM1]|uniref:DUF4190 domain-containing protein n=1 Tax=Mycobacterium sp. SM1 TaxID=2816243 RepID=UPI001BCD045C|nr:DUF4190 domain-containing protein [Mycobacterium sp. SM1]MBS4727354.1 DUF4190 domain-containing protein [Mycobacterium sp. SM1]
MTIPGGNSGEETHNEANAPPAEPTDTRPGHSPSSAPSGMQPPPTSPPSAHPPPPYPPPACPAVYPPPGAYPPPGYQYLEPSGDRGSPYPPGPPGYGTPYPPGYGEPYPAPDYPGGYGQPSSPGTNKLAIAALVASCLGLICGLGSILGVVLGTVALNQIKHTRQQGSGLAVAGIIVGIATLVVFMIYLIYARHHIGAS